MRGRSKEPDKRPDLPLPSPVARPVPTSGGLGSKHVCFECGAKFYDLGKPEPVCPKCGADQREAPRQTRVRVPPPPVEEPEPEPEEKPRRRSRLLDEDEEEIEIEPETDGGLDLGLGSIEEESEDFEEEEEETS